MLIRMTLIPFLTLAILGFMLSLVEQIRALSGLTSFLGSAFVLVFVGIFIVFVPAAIVGRRRTLGIPYFDQVNSAFDGCPKWVAIALGLMGVNAVANFILILVLQPSPHIVGPIPPGLLRLLSAFAMVFYGVSIALLYPPIRNGRLWRQIQCPNGHRLSSLASFCPFCGKSVIPDSSGPP